LSILVLVESAVAVGIYSGLTVAVLSPFFAFFLGIGPAFPQLLPLIALGNAVIVLVTWLFINKWNQGLLSGVLGVAVGAVSKFLVLWIGIVKILLPLIPALKPQQVQVLSASFSWPQLVTALIGATLAVLIAPSLRKAMRNKT